MDIGPGELVVILVVVLVLFGGSQLPKLARSIGEAQREFRRATTGGGPGAHPGGGVGDDESTPTPPPA
jgi:sec-independent protein translocase protein TatA